MSGRGSSPRPITSRARSSTIIGTGTLPPGTTRPGPPSIDVSASSFRITTNPFPGPSSSSNTGSGAGLGISAISGHSALDPSAPSAPSAAAEALSSQLHATLRRPRMQAAHTGHTRITSWPSPPQPVVMVAPSAPAVPTRASLSDNVLDLSALNNDVVSLLLYTYKPPTTTTGGPNKDKDKEAASQPSPLPSNSASASTPSSQVLVSYAALPWDAKPGDYLEIRRIKRKDDARSAKMQGGPDGDAKKKQEKSVATKGVKLNKGRDGYVFRLGEDMPNVNVHQIQVPDSVAAAFGFQHRLEVEVRRVHDKEAAHTDYVEFYFSQYLGRADMWRLGMSLEGTTLHVGEKVSLAGGAVRAEVNFLVRSERGGMEESKNRRYSSGIVTAKTKTIFRSKSAQVYLFIQLCQETWEFDEDGERYVEKIVHGYLPDLFAKWSDKGTSHVVTIIFFARIYYDDSEVEYMRRHDMTFSLIQDYSGRWCKDFFKVAIDLERKTDWTQALPEIKKQLESCEKEILLDYHLKRLNEEHDEREQRRIIGRWSFAYEGNVLEAMNLALNPFDEHYVDRDLSRTGLQITIVTPGTGHFAVDKNLLRLTTERTVDHGLSVDFLCLTKMPLHSVPLYSYVSHRPKENINDDGQTSAKKTAVTPDLLYFDARMSNTKETELADCYSLPSWVSCSFYAVTHDKPFRKDRFVPRCKMYEIQMLGILDHNLTTVIVPLLDVEDTPMPRRPLSLEDRKAIRDNFDAGIFGAKTDQPSKIGSPQPDSQPASISASYQSARLLAEKVKEDRSNSFSRQRMLHSSSKLSPIRAMVEHEDVETLGTKRTSLRSASPAPSSLSLKRSRAISPSRSTNGLVPGPPFGPMTPLPAPQAIHGKSDSPVMVTRATSPLPLASTATGDLSPTLETRIQSPASISRARSPSHASMISLDPGSGASTPKSTPAKKLQNKSSKSSFASRFGANWLFGSLTRAQPSFAAPAMETAARTDVSVTGRPASPKQGKPAPPALTRAMNVPNPNAIITPSTPSPSKDRHAAQVTQPLPIATGTGSRLKHTSSAADEDAISRSLRARSHEDASWRAKNHQLVQSTRHFTVNPCKPSAETIARVRDSGGRRWQFVLPSQNAQHIVKWPSLVAPACLPLTTDFLPTQKQTDELYTTGNYTVQCYLEEGAFFIRNDAAESNLPLAMMREMVSQRLSQNFQVIVLPHELSDPGTSRPMPIHLEKDADIGVELVSGGASEVLKNGRGAIWLSWANHIHRLLFHPTKQEIIVHWMTRKVSHSTDPVEYKCLVWPSGMKGYQRAKATFNYPDVNTKINYNHLDHLINGERQTLEPLRYWRTRYILIPSGREVASISGLPKGESFDSVDMQWLGAQKVIETLNRYLQKPPGSDRDKEKGDERKQEMLRIVPTTFDPSTCVLDDELMMDLERQISGKEKTNKERGTVLEGMTLAQVAEMMSLQGNGLVIRTRWWDTHQHVKSFTGAQFAEWLQNTFEDVPNREKAAEWAKSLLEKGLIEHVTNSHGFFDYWHLYYRLREPYDMGRKESKGKGWFGGKSGNSGSGTNGNTNGNGENNEGTMSTSNSVGPNGTGTTSLSASVSGTLPSNPTPPPIIATPPNAKSLLAKIYEGPDHSDDESQKQAPGRRKKRKIMMSQTRVLDLDQGKKSDRAEVAILHSDIVHNARNAFHFELNWLGVTAALLEELRQKLSATAERYGLRFVETPVEQLLDIPLKCAYRTAIPIPLALAPPIIPDLHKRLVAVAHGTGQASNYFEYAILTRKFGFVLDVEAANRYPDNIEVVYSYRKNKGKFDASQFCHRTGLALVQCLGGEQGFLWSDNRLVVSQPTRRAGAGGASGSRAEEAKALKEEMVRFCSDPEALRKFYAEVLPPLPGEGDVEGQREREGEAGERDIPEEEGVGGVGGAGSTADPLDERTEEDEAGEEREAHEEEEMGDGDGYEEGKVDDDADLDDKE